MPRGISRYTMARNTLTSELSVYLRVRKAGEVPLEVYDTLYYSGRFDPIYRIQGDMVLSAYYRPEGYRESRIRRMGRNVLKELTIDLKDRPGGTEVKVENMIPVFEEERSFFRDPKIRLSTKSNSTASRFQGTVDEQIRVLGFAESVLLKIDGLEPSEDGRLLLTLHDMEFETAAVKRLSAGLSGSGIRASVTRHTISVEYRRNEFARIALPFITDVLENNTVA